jgi:folate-dependent phosphoribosylglycinamide formyltransferase PurN
VFYLNNNQIRLAYITSPRELEAEGVGSDPNIIPTLQYLHNAIQTNPLLSNVKLVAVIVDDNGREFNRQYLEKETNSFRFLSDFCAKNNIQFYIHESINWRKIPKSDPLKSEKKKEYEKELLYFLRQNNIDIVLSDSYVVLFNSVMLDKKIGYPGLIINIHPAITSEVPGITPTKDALARGMFFTKDRQERNNIRSNLQNSSLQIRRDGYDRSIKNVLTKMNISFEFDQNLVKIKNSKGMFKAKTGATLHIVDEQIDHGEVILSSCSTPVLKGDGEQELRRRNYQTKNRVVENGLILFLKKEETQRLILENRIKNRAFNGDNLEFHPHLQTIEQKTLRQKIRWSIGR